MDDDQRAASAGKEQIARRLYERWLRPRNPPPPGADTWDRLDPKEKETWLAVADESLVLRRDLAPQDPDEADRARARRVEADEYLGTCRRRAVQAMVAVPRRAWEVNDLSEHNDVVLLTTAHALKGVGWCWATNPRLAEFDLEGAVREYLECEHSESAKDQASWVAIREAESLVDKALAGVVTWDVDRTVIVVLR